jgi:hypothetical protein
LITFEQQVVLNQHVRLEALDSLKKSMGDQQWSAIFACKLLPRHLGCYNK